MRKYDQVGVNATVKAPLIMTAAHLSFYNTVKTTDYPSCCLLLQAAAPPEGPNNSMLRRFAVIKPRCPGADVAAWSPWKLPVQILNVCLYVSSVPAGGLCIDKSVKEVAPVFDSLHFGIGYRASVPMKYSYITPTYSHRILQSRTPLFCTRQ